MSKLWLSLGLLSLVIGLSGYIHQEFKGAGWSWAQFWHHEVGIAVFISVGVALLVVGIVNKGGK